MLRRVTNTAKNSAFPSVGNDFQGGAPIYSKDFDDADKLSFAHARIALAEPSIAERQLNPDLWFAQKTLQIFRLATDDETRLIAARMLRDHKYPLPPELQKKYIPAINAVLAGNHPPSRASDDPKFEKEVSAAIAGHAFDLVISATNSKSGIAAGRLLDKHFHSLDLKARVLIKRTISRDGWRRENSTDPRSTDSQKPQEASSSDRPDSGYHSGALSVPSTPESSTQLSPKAEAPVPQGLEMLSARTYSRPPRENVARDGHSR